MNGAVLGGQERAEKRQIEETVRGFLEEALLRQDVEKTLTFLTEDIIGIGMGDQGAVASKEQVRELLRAGRRERDGAAYILLFDRLQIRFHPPDFGTFCAEIKLYCTQGARVMQSSYMQSASLKRVDGRWLICALHASPISLSEESIEAYPLKFAESALLKLRAELQPQALSLLDSSIPGGIVGRYMEEGYPVYFINERMLAHLGYTQRSFFEETGGFFQRCIHPKDRARVVETITKALDEKDEFELRYRMIKRDGDTCWMVERGRRGLAEEGRTPLISVHVDITQLVVLQRTLSEKAAILEEKNAELETLTNSVPGGVVMMRLDSRLTVLYANAFFFRMYGYTRRLSEEELDSEWMNMLPADGARRALEAVLEAYERNAAHFEFETQALKRGGARFWVLVRGGFIRTEGGTNVHCVMLDITERKRMEQALRLSEERFRIALEKTNNIIFDYDVLCESIMHSGTEKHFDIAVRLQDAPGSLFAGGVLSLEDRALFEAAFARIRSGAPQAECVVKAVHADGRAWWNRLAMAGIADEAGRNVRAIGMVEDITRQKETELAYLREEQYRQALLADTMAFYVVNFTQRRFESYKVDSPLCVKPLDDYAYDASLRCAVEKRLHEEDKRKFISLFSYTNVLVAFQRGETELKLEYRCMTPGGGVKWMCTTMRLMLDALTNDLKGFMYVIDIDERKREALRLEYRSQRDFLTDVYNKGAAEMKIREALQADEEARRAALLLLDVDHFKEVNDTYGHPVGDCVLAEAARRIRESFRESDIVGRLGGDEFCVFLTGIRTKEDLARIAMKLCHSFDALLPKVGDISISCSIGIARCMGRRKSFEQLYREADAALYQAKIAGRNGFAFFAEGV